MVPQISTVFYSMSLVLVILVIKALIAPHGVPCHLIWSFEEWLILNLLQNLIHRLLEHRVNTPGYRQTLTAKQSPSEVDCCCIGST